MLTSLLTTKYRITLYIMNVNTKSWQRKQKIVDKCGIGHYNVGKGNRKRGEKEVEGSNKFPRVFMNPGEFQISAGYADNVKYCQELRICLSPHDWSKFESQPFFRDLVEYLDNEGIQGNISSLVPETEKSENLQKVNKDI